MGVRRKATIIVTLAVLLTAAGAGYSPVYGRAVSSLRSFQRVFGDLKPVSYTHLTLPTTERV